MNTIILNGSPKGNSNKSNSQIFAKEFIKNMKNPCEIKCIAKYNPKELVSYIEGFDTIIIVLPLYIHAMPGIVMKFIEKLKPQTSEEKYIGFIVQAGFIETAQHKFLKRYFKDLAKQLNYNYLGTVSKGEAAGIYMYPKMFKKVLKSIADLGMAYEENHTFDKEIVQRLEKPYELSKFKLKMLRLVNKVGLNNIGWHTVLRKNNALDKRLDRPFL
ncbi:MAG: NAD(P)H-dependent oxidoreductase [Firmicutes bacterium]|nr:NAD(P)H-dependent oxidoreductase [Bacillota bacterium]